MTSGMTTCLSPIPFIPFIPVKSAFDLILCSTSYILYLEYFKQKARATSHPGFMAIFQLFLLINVHEPLDPLGRD
jgi:hypothetical protein